MKLTKAVKSFLLPVMENNEFSIMDKSQRYYEFSNKGDTLRVIVDVHPYPPPYLRTHFLFRNGHGVFSHFEFDQLRVVPDGYMVYSTQDDLEKKIALLSEIIDDLALPLLRNLFLNNVVADKKVFNLLADKPEQQAANFAERHNLSTNFECSNFLFLEEHISEMQRSGDKERLIVFNEMLPQIVNAIAYYGEILRKERRRRSSWLWDGGRLFGIKYSDGSWLHPHRAFIDFWNFTPYIDAHRLAPYSLRQHN